MIKKLAFYKASVHISLSFVTMGCACTRPEKNDMEIEESKYEKHEDYLRRERERELARLAAWEAKRRRSR